MSPAGPAMARGPEKWSDMSVGRLVQQRLQHGLTERLLGCRVVQHLLEGLLDPVGLADLRHREVREDVAVADGGP